MQALSKSDDSVRLEFIAIADLVKIIAQLLNDTVVAAIVSTEESDRYFASFLNEKEKEQQNIKIEQQLKITLKKQILYHQLYHQKKRKEKGIDKIRKISDKLKSKLNNQILTQYKELIEKIKKD